MLTDILIGPLPPALPSRPPRRPRLLFPPLRRLRRSGRGLPHPPSPQFRPGLPMSAVSSSTYFQSTWTCLLPARHWHPWPILNNHHRQPHLRHHESRILSQNHPHLYFRNRLHRHVRKTLIPLCRLSSYLQRLRVQPLLKPLLSLSSTPSLTRICFLAS